MSEHVERLPAARFPLFKKQAPLLVELDMELTERCNNDCIHCCINLPALDRVAQGRELTTDELTRILVEAAELGCLEVRYTGGEPLLRKDFELLYLCARRLGMKVLLFTNARLITKRLASLFARIPPLVPIEVSVYGMHRESYEAVSRAPGSFAQFRRGVGLLLEQRIPFIVKGALLPPNRGEIDEFEYWAATIPWMDRPPSYSLFFDLRGRRDDPEKNRQIQALRVPPQEGVAILARDQGRYRREMEGFCAKFMGAAGRKLFACGAGRGGCVDAYGRLQPCLSLRAPEFSYDLRRGTLRQALTEFFLQVLAVEAADQEYLARCARCRLKALCEQCPAKSWAEAGRLDKPIDYLCEVAHTHARRLGILGVDERGWNVTE